MNHNPGTRIMPNKKNNSQLIFSPGLISSIKSRKEYTKQGMQKKALTRSVEFDRTSDAIQHY